MMQMSRTLMMMLSLLNLLNLANPTITTKIHLLRRNLNVNASKNFSKINQSLNDDDDIKFNS